MDTLPEQDDGLPKSANLPAQLISAVHSTASHEPIVQSPNTVDEKAQQSIPAATALNDNVDPAESPASSVSSTLSENPVSPYIDLHSPFSSKPKGSFNKGRLRLLSLKSMEEFKIVPIQDKYPILKSILEFMKDTNISSER